MNKGKIYIVKNNINDLVYIGQTIQKLNQRWNKHLSDARTEIDVDNDFHKAIRELGEDNFYIELLEDNIPQSQLNQKEKEWILKFNSFNKGYNSCPGGNTGVNLGTGKKIYQIDIKTNKIINIFKTIQEAADAVGVSKSSISGVLTDETRVTSAGYKWCYDDNLEKTLKKEVSSKSINGGKKPIAQIDRETGEIIATYESATDAGKILGISNLGIGKVCRGERATYKNYVWKYI